MDGKNVNVKPQRAKKSEKSQKDEDDDEEKGRCRRDEGWCPCPLFSSKALSHHHSSSFPSFSLHHLTPSSSCATLSLPLCDSSVLIMFNSLLCCLLLGCFCFVSQIRLHYIKKEERDEEPALTSNIDSGSPEEKRRSREDLTWWFRWIDSGKKAGGKKRKIEWAPNDDHISSSLPPPLVSQEFYLSVLLKMVRYFLQPSSFVSLVWWSYLSLIQNFLTETFHGKNQVELAAYLLMEGILNFYFQNLDKQIMLVNFSWFLIRNHLICSSFPSTIHPNETIEQLSYFFPPFFSSCLKMNKMIN